MGKDCNSTPRCLERNDTAVLAPDPTARLQRAHFEPGDEVIRQGDEGETAYVIESGRLEVLKDGSKPGNSAKATVLVKSPCSAKSGEPPRWWGGGPPRRGQNCTEQDFRLFLPLSGSRPDTLKRAQLDHLCMRTLKGP